MLKSFFVCNYKNLRLSRPIKFAPFNIIVGDNGDGKTNMINAISFLADIFNSGFPASLKKRHYNSILNKFTSRKDVYLKWIVNTGKGYPDLSYEINILFPDKEITSIKIKNELLKYAKPKKGEKIPFRFIKCHEPYNNECEFPLKRNNSIVTERYMVDDRRSVFDQLDILIKDIRIERDTHPMFLDVVEAMKKYFAKWFNYNFLLNKCAGLSAEYTPFDYYLNENGTNFANVIRNLGVECEGFCSELKNIVAEMYPNIEKIHSVLDDNEVHLKCRMKKEDFYFNELSTGIARSVLIATILFSPYNANVLCLENVEAGFSEKNRVILRKWLKRVSKRIQLFITTSSYEFVQGFIEDVREDFAKIFFLKEGVLTEVNSQNIEEKINLLSTGGDFDDKEIYS